MLKSKLLLLLLIYITIQSLFLFKEPTIWPDEVNYTADMAYQWLNLHHWHTEVWQDYQPAISLHTWWYTPFYFQMTLFWFQIFGLSLFTQRLMSALLGGLFIFLFYYVTRHLAPRFAPWITLGLICDEAFLKSTRVGRAEIVCLVLLFLGLIATYAKRKFRLSGLLATLAFLTHPVGAFWTLPQLIFVRRHVHLFLLGLCGPLSLWLLLTHPYWTEYVTQLQLATIRLQASSHPWAITASVNHFSLYSISVYTLALLSVGYLVYGLLLSHTVFHRHLALLLVTAWLVFFWGKLYWYFVYVIPLAYLALAILASRFRRLLPILGLLICINVLRLAQSSNSFDYWAYTQQLLSLIPDHTTVFLSSIPDPYYGFIQAHRHNKLYEFPAGPITPDSYTAVLDHADYIIYSSDLAHHNLLGILPDFIAAHAKQSQVISTSQGYAVTLIRLK